MARSREIDGPYEMHPNTHLITSKDDPSAPLQRAGHGQYVETPDGQVYHTHLCGRPLPPQNRCTLGRETGLQKCVWKNDDWLYLASGGVVPQVDVEAPAGAPEPHVASPLVRRFDGSTLHDEFQWLRTPEPERIFSLSARPGLCAFSAGKAWDRGSSRRWSPAGRSIIASVPKPRLISRPIPISRPRASRITTTATSCMRLPSPSMRSLVGW